MAIKRKLTPKAGPKKRRTKKEMDEARKAEAISKNQKPVKQVKRAGRVRSYTYGKKTEDDNEGKAKPRSSMAFRPDMKKPKKREDVPSLVRWLDRHEKEFDNPVDATRHFQEKVCLHSNTYLSAKLPLGNGRVKSLVSCNDCGRVTSSSAS